MRKIAVFLFLSCLSATAFGQQASSVVRGSMSQAEIDRIIQKFTANEAEFREALKGYVFNRNVTVQTLGLGGHVNGQYRRDSYMTFKEDGGRFEKILFNPVSTLQVTITAEDLEDLGGVNPFALEPNVISQYNINYVGTENIDGLRLYVFDVAPKVMPDPKKTKLRLFSGRIWVDTDDLMIVRSKGKGVPEGKDDRYPTVETTRLPVDNKYYFPVDARADDELVFRDGTVVRIRMRVSYANYRLGRSEVRILDDVPDPKPTPTPTQSPTPKDPD